MQQSRHTGALSLTNTSDQRNVAFELGNSNLSPASSTRATTSPRALLQEWSIASGRGFDSGYQTDSPMQIGTTSMTQAARSTGGSVPPADDQQEQFRMSMEDLRPGLPQLQPPPGTFRPVSPPPLLTSPVARLQQSYHRQQMTATSRLGFRPPSVPMADLPDNEDQLLADEEVENVAFGAQYTGGGGGASAEVGQLPDLVLETTVVDVRFRSQSVPVFPDQLAFLQQVQEHAQMAPPSPERSITQVAMELRRIGDEISIRHGHGGSFTIRRMRGYSVGHDARPQASGPDAVAAAGAAAGRRRSSDVHPSAAAAAASYSYPGEASTADAAAASAAGYRMMRRRQRFNGYGARGGSNDEGGGGGDSGSGSDSWLERFSRVFRTLSGASIAMADADSDAQDVGGVAPLGGGAEGLVNGGAIFEDFNADEEED